MLSSALLSALLAAPAFAASASDWQTRSIYQLVTDRFAVSDDSGPKCDTSDRVYCGGSFKGIVNHLDYIQNMGFDAIWISPVSTNFEGKSSYGEAFHGYWPTDITTINKHFGSPEELKALSDALHKRGMYLMLDVVVNHLAATTDSPDFHSSFIPFDDPKYFHNKCFVQNYDNQTEVEQCWLGDDKLALVDINTEDDGVINTMHNFVKGLVSNFSADGVRIDTVKHVRKDFWPDFGKAAGVFTIGEVLSNETSYIQPYTENMDSVLDYSTWFPLVAAFQTKNGNCSALAEHTTTVQKTFKNGLFGTGSFLENHDQPRFGSLTQDTVLVQNAMVWPFVHDGIPILYYGQEQGYQGGADPANREALWSSGYAQDKDLVKQVKALNGARKAAIGANKKFTSTAMTFPSTTQSTIAIAKPGLLALLTNVGTGGKASWKVDGSASGFEANTDLVDVLSCTTVHTDGQGGVSVDSDGGKPKVLVPAKSLDKKGSLCQNLATGSSSSSSSSGSSSSSSGKNGAVAMGKGGVLAAVVATLVGAAVFA